MDTILGYLESMFATLPDTPELLRAKRELGQMMEDKYSELIAKGVSENEAIGTVISEFGNLDEVAQALGIEDAINSSSATKPTGRALSSDEAKTHLADCGRAQHPAAYRESPRPDNQVAQDILSLFWPTVTCIYLIWSFLTFRWYISWIIWPIAAVIERVARMALGSASSSKAREKDREVGGASS